jgi:hypothetical protein
LLVAVVATIFLTIASSAFTQEVPAERNSLIRLGSRVFDLGTDVRRMRRDPHFIPVTDVRWINALTDSDPHLRYTVIHIPSIAGSLGTPIWLPDTDREQYAPAKDLAEAWALSGYDVRWRHKVAPATRGSIVLFPKSPGAGHYISCEYDRADQVPTYCAANVLYPPSPDLRIRVRIYQITDPLNDFEAITKRALDLVHCLDVTRAVEAGTWEPLQVGQWRSLTEFLSTCRNVSS